MSCRPDWRARSAALGAGATRRFDDAVSSQELPYQPAAPSRRRCSPRPTKGSMTSRRSSLAVCAIAATSCAFWLTSVRSFAASENAGFKSGIAIAQLSSADRERFSTALHRKLTSASEQLERLTTELSTLAPQDRPATGLRRIPTKEEIEAYNQAKQLRDQLNKLRTELERLKQHALELQEAASRARGRCQDALARLNAVGASAGVGAAIGGIVGGPFAVPVGAAAGAAIGGAVSPPNPDDLDDCREAARLEAEAGQLDMQSEKLLSDIQRIDQKIEDARKREQRREQERMRRAVTRSDKKTSGLLKPPQAVGKKDTAAVGAGPRKNERGGTKPMPTARKPMDGGADRSASSPTRVPGGGGTAMDRLSGASSGSAGGGGSGAGGRSRSSGSSPQPGSGGGSAMPAATINRNAIGGGPERIR